MLSILLTITLLALVAYAFFAIFSKPSYSPGGDLNSHIHQDILEDYARVATIIIGVEAVEIEKSELPDDSQITGDAHIIVAADKSNPKEVYESEAFFVETDDTEAFIDSLIGKDISTYVRTDVVHEGSEEENEDAEIEKDYIVDIEEIFEV